MRNTHRTLGFAFLFFCLLTSVALGLADERSDKVDKLFAEWDKPDSPGYALAVIQDGKILYTRGYGSANLELGVPLSPQSVFYIASTSKQFTAACVALLAKQGKLSLEDDIRKYVPEIPDYGTPITIRNLLHHTSGLRDYLTLEMIGGKSFGEYHKADVLELLSRQKELNFAPGTEFLYSNTGYFLLAVIAERAGGKSFRELTRELIFKPLGMENSHFHDDYQMLIKNRASGYFPASEKGKFANYISTFDCVGDGGLYTSVEDLFHWDQNFYTHQVGGPDLVAQIQTPGVLKNGEKLDYAFGLMIGTYKGLRTVIHGGALEGYRTEIIRFPDERFSVICLSNFSGANPTKLGYEIAQIYLAGKLKEDKTAAPKPGGKPAFLQLPEEKLKDVAGMYFQPAEESIVNISFGDGKLWLEFMGRRFALGAMSETELRVLDAPVEAALKFEKPTAGKPMIMNMVMEGQKGVRYEKIEPAKPTPAELQEFAGDYRSEELDTTFRLAEKDGKLFFVHKNAVPNALQPTLPDKFAAGPLALRFVRGNEKKITGFALNAGRVKNMSFVKK